MSFSDTLLPMALFALATSATPGQVNVISAMTGASFGPIRTIPYVMGATTSFVSILLLLGLGLGVVLEWIGRFSPAFIVVGSAYMLWLAFRIATDCGKGHSETKYQRCPDFKAGLITQVVNPKAWIVSLSAISVYVAPHVEYNSRLAVFAAIFAVVCAASLFGWAVIGFRVARLSGDVSTFNKIMAGVLTFSVFMILIEEFYKLNIRI
jgi:threonine/homoserine/homoserine lactone efflux protein